jgi:uncharacterized protein
MKLENEFTVPASIDEAWAFLLDVPRVAPCLPGATVEGGGGEDGEYQGAMKIKIGPISASYKGTVRIQEADESARRVAMRAQAKDARGQGTAAATITSTMEETADGTKVHVETDMRVTGPAAQFGRGVMQDVSTKLMKRFADCLAAEIAEGATATAVTTAGNGAAPAAAEDLVATGTAGVLIPPGPAGEHAEAVARARAQAASGAPTRSPASPPAADDVAGPPDVLDLGEIARGAVLKRAAPVVAAAIVAGVVIWRLRR